MTDLFDRVAAAVRETLLDVSAGELAALSGHREGQYRLDLRADELVVAPLRRAGLSVLSEESGWHGPPPGPGVVAVVVDPVDGSTNAARGLPFSACSLCAVDSDGPWVATVVDLARGTTYRAVRGAGATRDGRVVAVNSAAERSTAVVGVNGWCAGRPPTWQVRAFGCAALELCAVADGGLDGYVNLDRDGHGPWDYLGGLLVASEAGAVLAERHGRDLTTLGRDVRRDVVAAATPGLADVLSALGDDR